MDKYIVCLILCMLIIKTHSMNNQTMSNPKDLLEAVGLLQVDKVRTLLKSSTSIGLEEKNHNGQTALFVAVKPSFFDSRYPTEEEKNKQVEIIKLLLDSKASPDVLDNNQKSLYQFAVMANWEHVLKALNIKRKDALEKSTELVLEKSNTLIIDS